MLMLLPIAAHTNVKAMQSNARSNIRAQITNVNLQYRGDTLNVGVRLTVSERAHSGGTKKRDF